MTKRRREKPWKRFRDRRIAERNKRRSSSGSELVERYKKGERDFSGITLDGAGLREADLREINLKGANLRRADLRRAKLQGADLRDTHLDRADLREANLEGALVTGEQLAKAASLKGAIMPDGTRHE